MAFPPFPAAYSKLPFDRRCSGCGIWVGPQADDCTGQKQHQLRAAIGIDDRWSEQRVDIWQIVNGNWLLFRQNERLWNYWGSLREHPALASGFYFFPHGFTPTSLS